jgi:putative tricarboxylic transport membrane protein
MSEGVQASPNPVGQSHAFAGAISAIILGLACGVAGFSSPAGSFARDILYLCGVALAIAGVVLLVLRRGVQGPRDYYGGLALIGMAAFAFWASNDLPGMHGFAFGPGTGPRIFASLLAIMGVIVAAIGLLTEGEGLQRYAFRGPFFITVATIVFALTIRSFGLVVSSFVSIVISAFGSSEVRWIETIIWAAVLTVFCSLLFPYALNLPIPLWPQNLTWSTMFSLR